jgi:2-keto-4-pentenoate hydratase/2-oxohepta-3-ene-1,7-dioic acid hydratase in catechol pathway
VVRLASFSLSDGPPRPGLIVGHEILDLSDAATGLPSTMAGLLALGSEGLERARAAPRGRAARHDLSTVRRHAPLPDPPAILAIGMNYRAHVAELGREPPEWQYWFNKQRTSISGPGDPIVLPSVSDSVDYEGELALVIGPRCQNVPAARAFEVVAGYTIINDVSARDIQRSTTQWSMAKSFPTFCPMGPAIVTADEIADPHALKIGLSIDGEVLQDSTTSELIFKIPELIEYLSSIAPLLPGDIVSTGTPSGVGMGRTPKRWLKPGENVTVTIEGLGSLTNPVVAE